jgi:hypothetical protein
VFSSFKQQDLNRLITIPTHNNFFATMVIHKIPNPFHHPFDHGPIFVVLHFIILKGTWRSRKKKHNLHWKTYNGHILGIHDPFITSNITKIGN